MVRCCKTLPILLLLLVLLGGCSAEKKHALMLPPAGISQITVVSDDNYPPYIFRDSAGKLQGIIVDQWALWEQKTGVKAVITGMPWNDALSAMQRGEFDVIDTMFINEERFALYDFSSAYATIEVPIFFSNGVSGIRDAESLHGFPVAVKSGDFCVNYLRSHGVTSFVEYPSYEAIIDAAKRRAEPVFVMDKPPAVYLMIKAGIQDSYYYTPPLYTGEFHRAVAKGRDELLALLEMGFTSISEKEYKSIDTKWSGTEVPYIKYLPHLGYGVAGALALLLFMALWNRSLKRMVGQRTAELEHALEDLRNRERSLYELSVYDSLTQLHNRNFFIQKIEALSHEGKPGIGYVTCDLDGLKLINDTLGHAAGDDYVRLAAGILERVFGKNAVIARIGGDEFGILLQDADESMLESLRQALIAQIDQANAEPRAMPLSLSFGCALWNAPNVPLEDVMKKADDLMHRDKLNHIQSIKSKNIELLTNMLVARDFITEGHGERLQELSVHLAQAAGLSAADVRDVELLAKFHDIGKIGIPDTILFKPDGLTDEEMTVMRRHTEIGYRIAMSSPDLIHIADWILKHHEKFDGNGYPFGLKGVEIPVQCRIVAIIDAYDAMTNDRPYRKAAAISVALGELMRNAGTQFDPYLVKEFCRIVTIAEMSAS